tara:strand:+ start:357 stop:518 length:162 start_codon:yes stop_codon:yes gene_type:complete
LDGKKLYKMAKTKKVTISITPEQQEEARKQSKTLFGKENISGYIGYLIEKERK